MRWQSNIVLLTLHIEACIRAVLEEKLLRLRVQAFFDAFAGTGPLWPALRRIFLEDGEELEGGTLDDFYSMGKFRFPSCRSRI